MNIQFLLLTSPVQYVFPRAYERIHLYGALLEISCVVMSDTSMVNSIITKRDRECFQCRMVSGCGLIGSGLYVCHHTKKYQNQVGKAAMYAIASGTFARAHISYCCSDDMSTDPTRSRGHRVIYTLQKNFINDWYQRASLISLLFNASLNA